MSWKCLLGHKGEGCKCERCGEDNQHDWEIVGSSSELVCTGPTGFDYTEFTTVKYSCRKCRETKEEIEK